MMRAVAFVLGAAACVFGQDMRGLAVGCGDVHRKCEMDCLLPTYRSNAVLAWPYVQPETLSELSSCVSLCKITRQTCVESPEATDALSCIETCSSKYDAEMQSCLQAMDSTTTMTFGTNLDACSVASSTRHDMCTNACHGSDAYDGWSPEAEEGLSVTVKFTVPGYREQLKETQKVAAMKRLALNPTLETNLLSSPETGSDIATEWALRASGAFGATLVVVGLALETFSGSSRKEQSRDEAEHDAQSEKQPVRTRPSPYSSL